MTELWQQEAEKSTIPRLAWKKLIGQTLTAYITDQHNLGLTGEQIYDKIVTRHKYLTTDAKHRLQISISARISEQKAMIKRLKRSVER